MFHESSRSKSDENCFTAHCAMLLYTTSTKSAYLINILSGNKPTNACRKKGYCNKNNCFESIRVEAPTQCKPRLFRRTLSGIAKKDNIVVSHNLVFKNINFWSKKTKTIKIIKERWRAERLKNVIVIYLENHITVISFYSSSCLGLETANEPFGIRVKLSFAHLSTTHGEDFTISLSMLNIK